MNRTEAYERIVGQWKNLMVDYALAYAERGWPVFPCEPRGKRPLTLNGLKDATTDPDKIRQWWDVTLWPDANIGLATDHHFDVFDVDGDEGLNELSRHVGGDDQFVADTPVVNTPSGGAHFYFEPGGFGNKARFAPGLDWRGDGGYVIAPPSLGANGIEYRWHEEAGVTFTRDRPLAPVPAWLQAVLAPPQRRAESTVAWTKYQSGPKKSYAAAALRNETDRVTRTREGQRNDTLVRAAFSLGQLAGRLDPNEAFDALLRAALKVGLPEREARRTIRSGLEAGAQQPRTA